MQVKDLIKVYFVIEKTNVSILIGRKVGRFHPFTGHEGP